MQAQLRAAVFLALDDREDALRKQPLMNQQLKKFLASEDGRLCSALVWEFMEFFNLDYSLSVFARESYSLGVEPTAPDATKDGDSSTSLRPASYKGRRDLTSALGLSDCGGTNIVTTCAL